MAVDSDPGVGIGMPVSPSAPGSAIAPTGLGGIYGLPYTHMSLEEYAEFLQIPEPYLFGIRGHPDYVGGGGCGDYWQQSERFWLASAIDKSEERMKADRWLGFPIRREYEKPRKVKWGWPAYLGKYVRGMGIQAESAATTIDISAQIGAGDDPVLFTSAVTFTDIDELVIYYPGQTKYRIRPSAISISSGVVTVEIPRSRLLKPEYLIDYDDVNERPLYTDDSYFLASVDAVRNYLDTTTGNNLVWTRQFCDSIRCFGNGCSVCNPSNPCGEVKQLACGYVRDQRGGLVQFEPATYNGGWSHAAYAVRRDPDWLEVNSMRFYYDRYDEMDSQLKRAIIALAHNNMPQDPCMKCAIQQQYYKRDVSPLEPPVSLGLGPSTWGIYEATQIIQDFDAVYHGAFGGML